MATLPTCASVERCVLLGRWLTGLLSNLNAGPRGCLSSSSSPSSSTLIWRISLHAASSRRLGGFVFVRKTSPCCLRLLLTYFPLLQHASQARLYEVIDLRGVRQKSLSFVAENPRVGRLVRSLLVTPKFDATVQVLRSVVNVVPALERVEWLSWSGEGLPAPPAPSDRPSLRSLKLTLHDRGEESETPAAYFDLSTLRHLEINTPDSQRHTERLLRAVTNGLTTLSILNFECEDLPLVMRCIRRFGSLADLSLVIWRSTSPLPADLLAPFRSLRRLKLAHDDVGPALSRPLALLEVLIISLPPDDYPGPEEDGFVPSHPLARNVAELCRIIKDFPKRFPALRNVCLDPPYEAITFAAEVTQQRVDLAAIGRQLREAGLALVDSEGLIWRADWEKAA